MEKRPQKKEDDIFTRKTLFENADPKSRGVVPINKKVVTDASDKGIQAKMRKPVIIQTRRAAFGDITNATQEQSLKNDKKNIMVPLKVNGRGNIFMPCNKATKPLAKKKTESKKETTFPAILSQNSSTSSSSSSSETSDQASFSSQEDLVTGLSADRDEGVSIVIVEDCDADVGSASSKSEVGVQVEKSLLSVDEENYTDIFNVGIYAQHIFDYYKRREKMFCIPAYMSDKLCHITPQMRAILVDWMVEIQENFELCHETLYLAVKLTDMYLSRVSVDKKILQIIGAASIFIASKFDERCPPLIEDFTYICDNAFDRDQFISMEIEVLKTVDFDLGIPISYRFLRRYAKVARMSIQTLTLARYILEKSLMEYDLVVARDSMKAAAALYIAQKMRSEGTWEGDVVKSSGYTTEDIKDLVVTLNTMLLASPAPRLSTIHRKYSHEIFHEVAKITPLPTKDLL